MLLEGLGMYSYVLNSGGGEAHKENTPPAFSEDRYPLLNPLVTCSCFTQIEFGIMFKVDNVFATDFAST